MFDVELTFSAIQELNIIITQRILLIYYDILSSDTHFCHKMCVYVSHYDKISMIRHTVILWINKILSVDLSKSMGENVKGKGNLNSFLMLKK